MAQLFFKVKNQDISRLDDFKVVARSKDYLYAKFEFTDDWSGEITAQFRNEHDIELPPYEVILDENRECEVPWEVLQYDNTDFYVTAFCGNLVTATAAKVHVHVSGYSEDGESSQDPTPSVYAQIVERLNKVENLAVDAESLPAGSEAEVTKTVDPETGGYVFDFGIPKGDKGQPGDDGFSPVVTISDMTDGHTVTITDESGPHSFDVMDGNDYVLTQQDKEDIAQLVYVPGAEFHICTSGEYDPSTGIPTIQSPREHTFYLVPSSAEESNNIFVEWIYVNNTWEIFGSAKIDLSDYATKTELNGKVDKVTGKGLSTNDFTTALKTKLDRTNITFCTCTTQGGTAIKVATIVSTGNTSFSLNPGTIVAVKFSYTNSASNPKLNVNSTGAKYMRANGSQITTSNLHYGGFSNRTMFYVYDGSQWTFFAWDTVYSNATQSLTGLMSAADKTKLDGIETEANKTVVDNALDGESTNPVQNAVVTEALDGKVDISDLAPAYSTSGTYAVGDYVTYTGNVYRCTTAITTAEAWTAAHWTQVAIGDELSSTKADLSQKITAPQTAGTSGQVLTSDGQGGQYWHTPSGGGGTSDYTDLENKPQINSVTLTGNKSLANLGVAPIINAERSAKYTNISECGAISDTISDVYATGLGIARFIAYDGSNLLGDFKDYDIIQDWGSGSCILESDHLILTGTSNRTLYLGKNNSSIVPITNPIPSGSRVYFGVIVKGTSTGGSALKVTMSFFNESGTTISWNQVTPYGESSWFGSASLSQDAYSAQVIFGKDETWVCDGLEVYPFVFATSNYIIDNNVIAEGIEKELDISLWSKISSAPYTHHLSYKADTKNYIDNHTPDDYVVHSEIANFASKQELQFITPEMFGAVGDNDYDDTQALQDCIDYAVNNNKVVRGFGRYRTTGTITISGEHLDIYLSLVRNNSINNSQGIELLGKYNRLTIDYLYCNNGDALVFTTDNSHDCSSNIVDCQTIYSNNGRAVVFTKADSSKAQFFNELHSKFLYAPTSNCIYFDLVGDIGANETYIIGNGMRMSSGGWAVFIKGGAGIRLYGLDLESSAKKGIYLDNYLCGAEIIDSKTTEMMDCIDSDQSDSEVGLLAKGAGVQNLTVNNTMCDYRAIDVSECLSAQERLDTGETYVGEIGDLRGVTFNKTKIFRYCDALAHDEDTGTQYNSQCFVPMGTEMIVWFDKKYLVSASENMIKVNADITIPASGYNITTFCKVMPTVFDIKENSVITLSASYNPIATSKITVLQDVSGKTAQIYDSTGTLIFDGATLGAGHYDLTSVIDPNKNSASIPTSDYHLFLGSNMTWIVNKTM